MPKLIDYHVYVTFPGVGELEVFPKNDTISYGWEKTNDVWRKKVDTKLWFINEPGTGIHTFDIFASFELEECGCHRFDMRITLKCPGSDEVLLYPGILFFIDGEWFFDFCSVAIAPRVNDPFECLFKNWETETNILFDAGPPIALTTDQGNFHQVTCTAAYPGGIWTDHFLLYEDGCLAIEPGNDWQVLIQHVFQPTATVFVETTWIREEFVGAGPPLGSGWTQVAPTLWTRPAILQGPTIEQGVIDYLATWTLQSRTLDNGRLLIEVLIKLFSTCADFPLRSDFLGIDPDGSAPANAAYAYAQAWIYEAVVFNMSDVVRSGAFENATKSFITLQNLLKGLRLFWKCFLYFDEDNQVYRIEHESFERHSKLINLVKKRPDAIRGYNSYTYEKVRIPQKQTFSWAIFQTNDEDWDQASIIYSDCNDVGRIEDNNIEFFHTDFGSLVGSNIEDIDILKGLVIVSQKDGEINRAVGDISGVLKVNGGLSWANVVRYLWRWRMPACTGIVNGVERSFLSLIPKIRGTSFSAELCCMDILQINPAIDRVRTGLGNGELEPFSIDLSSGMMEFNLLYAPPIMSTPELPTDVEIVQSGGNCQWDYLTFSLNEELSIGIGVEWNFGSGAVPAVESGAGPHTVYYSTVGPKVITCELSSGGNSVVLTFNILIVACPVHIVSSDDVLCFYQDFIFSLDTELPMDATVEWDFGAGGAGVPPTASGPGPHTVYYTSADNYFITATITYSNHTDILLYEVLVAECDPEITVNDDTQCYFTDFIFGLSFELDPGDTYAWNFGSGSTPGTATGSGPHTVQYTTAGTKTITCTITHPDLTTVDVTTTVVVSSCPGAITGTVKDTNNVGYVANVRLFHDDNLDGVSDGGAPVKSVNSASSGSWSMTNVTPGNYVIVLTVPGGHSIVSGIDVSPDGDLVADTNTADAVIPCTITPSETDGGNNFIITP